MTEQPISSADLDELLAEVEQLRAQVDAAEQRYRDLFESTGDSVFIIDADTYHILDVNKHGVRRFGYTHAELIEMTLDQIENRDCDRSERRSWVASFSGSRVYECRYRHKNGDVIPVEVSSRLIRVDGRAVLQNFVRNISHRQQIETERERLITDFDNFAHTVAHDLHSPLTVMRGYAEILETDWESIPAGRVDNALHIIAKSSQRLTKIVDALLLFASIRHHDRLDVSVLEMEWLVAEAEERLHRMIAGYGAEIIVPAAPLPGAIGYAPWVMEIWVIFLSNAIKYGGSPPVIEVGGALEDDGQVRFWLRDNGAGIAPDQLPYLFEKFNRFDDASTEGHGLGLAIARRIAEKLGGSVGVESVVGEGSTFSFTLPGAPSNYF